VIRFRLATLVACVAAASAVAQTRRLVITSFCVHDELALMVRGGMTPQAALQTATINPSADIANVRQIRAVIVAGRLLDRAALDQVLADVRAAAAQP
jgi:hypothetical protein